jgi:hypothetical protein
MRKARANLPFLLEHSWRWQSAGAGGEKKSEELSKGLAAVEVFEDFGIYRPSDAALLKLKSFCGCLHLVRSLSDRKGIEALTMSWERTVIDRTEDH